MAGLTIDQLDRRIVGDCELRRHTVTFDSSYPTGGEALVRDDLGYQVELIHVFDGIARKPGSPDTAVQVTYDAANGLLVAIWGDDDGTTGDTADAEVADTTDLSGYIVTLVSLGK